MKLTKSQHVLLFTLSDARAFRVVRSLVRAQRFTSQWRASGAREDTIDALASAGLILVTHDHDPMVSHVTFAKITPAGLAYLAKRARSEE